MKIIQYVDKQNVISLAKNTKTIHKKLHCSNYSVVMCAVTYAVNDCF